MYFFRSIHKHFVTDDITFIRNPNQIQVFLAEASKRLTVCVSESEQSHVFKIGTVWTIYRDSREIVDEIADEIADEIGY